MKRDLTIHCFRNDITPARSMGPLRSLVLRGSEPLIHMFASERITNNVNLNNIKYF